MAKKASTRKAPVKQTKKLSTGLAQRVQFEHPAPYFLEVTGTGERPGRLKLKNVDVPLGQSTLGDLGLAVRVTGPEEFPLTILVQPYDPGALKGMDRASVRMFRWDENAGAFRPVWNSGINLAFNFVWAKIQHPGIYVPIGLPRDQLLRESLRALSYQRSLLGSANPETARELTLRALEPFLEFETEMLEKTRDALTRVEIATAPPLPLGEYNFGIGGHPLPFPLPGGRTLDEFREQLKQLDVPVGGLPEEQLFRPPDNMLPGELPWAANPDVRFRDILGKELFKFDLNWELILPWLFSKDWPMYQHDVRHSGRASGISSITSTTAGQLTQRFKINLDGIVNSKPSIADGYAYIGTSRHGGGPGGTLYKIDLCSGCIVGTFETNPDPHFYSIHGIGGSPAIYEGKVYFTTVAGKVFCVNAASMTSSLPHPPALWITDLKNPNSTKNQPVRNPTGDCWSSPLVVNDRVYVGSGEGEDPNCWGFIWCLDANTGQVLWLFCTNKAIDINNPGNENQPNEIPRSAAVSDPLPAWATAAGFSIMNDPPETGSSPWSSFAYDSVLQQVYVGTGNSEYAGGFDSAIAPDQRYGSGLIALDANTGQFRGFHTAQPDDSYHANDTDIDVPGSPTIFNRGGQRVVCYGSKNGSFFLLDPGNLQVLGGGAQRRQLLARQHGTGHPGNRGNPISGVATGGGVEENKWGVMATPAVHAGFGKIFVGLGGYSGAGDGTKTPFIRALDWNNLNDGWPTLPPDAAGVVRYGTANPPLYQRANEAALSSPAVVNDVVLVSTTDTVLEEMSLYALDAATGLCLWSAPKVSNGGWPNYALGPAISGEYVVAGAGDALYIYTRASTPWCLCWVLPPWWEWWLEVILRKLPPGG